MPVYFKRQAQVEALLFNKASTKILVKYSNYSNMFLVENTAKFSKNIKINKYTIKLGKDK